LWNGNIGSQKEVQSSNPNGEGAVVTIVGCIRASLGRLPSEVHNGKELKSAIRNERRGLLSKYVAMLHDKIMQFSALPPIVEGHLQLNFGVLKHTPY
jgi:hypothetical protein